MVKRKREFGFLYKYRLATFNTWPFKIPTKCTAEKLAQTGFYKPKKQSNSLICYFCKKELDGWEETDDPYQEHLAHSPSCPHVKMFNGYAETMTVAESIRLKLASDQLLLTQLEKRIYDEQKKILKKLERPT